MRRTEIGAFYIVQQKSKTMLWHQPEISGGVFEVLFLSVVQSLVSKTR